MSQSNGLDKALNIEKTLLLISNSLVNSELILNMNIVWWVIGGIICVLITSLDTWLLGFTQHLKRNKDINDLEYAPYIIGIVVSLLSLFVNYSNIYFLGTLALNILLLNSATLTQKVFFPQIIISTKIVYFCLIEGIVYLSYFSFIQNNLLNNSIHIYTIFQTAFTFTIILIFPLIGKSWSKHAKRNH